MAQDEKDGCYVAHDALAFAQELSNRMNALTRRTDIIENDKNRLGERVTAVEDHMTRHESLTQEAVAKLNDSLDDFKTTMERALSAPPVPAGSAFVQSWQETPAKHKSLILGSIVGVLMAPEFLKWAIPTVITLIKKALHIP